MTICGERTEQLDIFCHVTGFMSDFLIFIDVELIRFFHGALQLFKKIIINSPKITQKTIHRLLFLTVLSARRRMLEHPRGRREGRGHIMSVVLFLRSVNVDGSTCTPCHIILDGRATVSLVSELRARKTATDLGMLQTN